MQNVLPIVKEGLSESHTELLPDRKTESDAPRTRARGVTLVNTEKPELERQIERIKKNIECQKDKKSKLKASKESLTKDE